MKAVSARCAATAAAVLFGIWFVAPAKADLLLHWTFDEETGPIVDHGVDAAADGAFFGEASRTTNTPGPESMRALDLVGTNGGDHNYASADFPAKLNQHEQMTLAFWINMQGTPANLDRVASMWMNNPSAGWELRIGNPSEGSLGADNFRFDFRSNAIASNSPDIVGRDNEWLFVAVTYDSTLEDTNTVFYLGTADDQASELGAWTPNSHPVPGLPPEGTEFRVGSTFAAPTTDRTPPAWIDDFRVYDEVLDLAQIEQARLAVLTTMPPVVPGDFDGDGDVDGADFVVWQTNFPTQEGATLATGDADGDGDVDGADFVIWQTNFPFTPSPSISFIPEPSTCILTLFAFLVLDGIRLRARINADIYAKRGRKTE